MKGIVIIKVVFTSKKCTENKDGSQKEIKNIENEVSAGYEYLLPWINFPRSYEWPYLAKLVGLIGSHRII